MRSRESSSGDVVVAGRISGEVRSRLSTEVAAIWGARGGGRQCLDCVGTGRGVSDCPPVRSRVSSSGVGALVLFSRGDVRRACVVAIFVFCFSPLDDLDKEEERDALDDIEVSGGRARAGWAGTFDGDENVKSRVSIRSEERRSCVGVGMGASSNILVVFRTFVGVWEARHVSSVVCLPFPGEAVTDVPRVGFVVRVLAFLARACDGDGCADELARSNVSIVSSNGGKSGRPRSAVKFAGSVFERCIGSRRLRLVTLAGKSSKTGERDISRGGRIAGGLLCCRTGEEESKSTNVAFGRAVGGCTSLLGALDDARNNLEPGLVTFANV